MDVRFVLAAGQILVGALMAGLGGWQYVLGAPLPGVLGRSLRAGQGIDDPQPRRWQLSGAAQGLFGLGFLMFGAALILQGHVDEGSLGAIRTAGLVAWVIAVGILSVLLTRYRHRT
jgi:hypothetical protein